MKSLLLVSVRIKVLVHHARSDRNEKSTIQRQPYPMHPPKVSCARYTTDCDCGRGHANVIGVIRVNIIVSPPHRTLSKVTAGGATQFHHSLPIWRSTLHSWSPTLHPASTDAKKKLKTVLTSTQRICTGPFIHTQKTPPPPSLLRVSLKLEENQVNSSTYPPSDGAQS